ncbi:hypothetical protein EDB83DRAFT_2629146 [Lactarius deliciosus]|nr:hypothetical protein EDB83DRAFT_2629146 [Lactarius deliciosus]
MTTSDLRTPGSPPLKTCLVVTEREGLDLRIITHVAHIWSDRLRLTSICASFFTSVDSLLFKLASNKSDGSPTSKLALSSLAGALIFHVAAAILAYLGSFVLIRYGLRDQVRDTQAVTGSLGSNAPTAMSPATFEDSQPTNSSSLQMPPAVQSRHVRFSEKVECSATSSTPPRLSPTVTPSIFAGARSHLFSTSSTTATEAPTSLLHHPSSLDIHMQREFSYRRKVLCIVTATEDDGDGPKANAEKDAIALMLLLNKCYNVCTRFVLTGSILAVMGVVACIWGLLERAIAIFGSICVGACLVFGFGALR